MFITITNRKTAPNICKMACYFRHYKLQCGEGALGGEVKEMLEGERCRCCLWEGGAGLDIRMVYLAKG